MKKKNTILKKIGPVSLATMMALTGVYNSNANIVSVHAAEADASLGAITKIEKTGKNTVEITYENGYKGKFTFLENGIFRFNVDPDGKFDQYATPNSKDHTGKIQQQPDDSDEYAKPEASITDGSIIKINAGKTVVELDKATGLMTVKRSDGSVVFAESEPLSIASGSTVQKIAADENEYFYGGGTQNGRFSHKGQTIAIVNTNNWVDGGVSSPNPFYWSTKGYGVLRNTFTPGSYDFQNSNGSEVITTHEEKEFDAYYFVSENTDTANKAEELLNDYYKVTGNPVLLPEYAFYLGHLNCYNRDGWGTEKTDATLKNGKEGGHSQWTLEDGQKYWENGLTDGYVLKPDAWPETLNGTLPTTMTENVKTREDGDIYKFSARAVIDGHVDQDMPLGWFLPNDGYGCGYGQNGYEYTGGSTEEKQTAIDANVKNLQDFTDYAKTKGVTTGLWTQSKLVPDTGASLEYQKLRDFYSEVKVGGVTSLKTDVAWVGPGYSFGLDGITRAYDIVAETKNRPNIITLDGWAGTQRYGSIWTGDQYGGDWEYIRFHIPTYIGQSLSGNPNIGSDMDGIFGGGSVVSTRDYQWKSFTPQMLDMDGWGSLAKKPYYNGDPYTSINRMYLKLKAELMPYTYTYAKEATNGLPMIRAMFLEYPEEENAYNKRNTEYQYMYGDSFLVAPVYEDVASDENGNDVRQGIYLPDENEIWIDYFTGKQYQGGQTLNNFDAPIWKLPLFVKNGSIVPMYAENNNPQPVSSDNKNGLDKTKRIVEFWPAGSTDFELFEDDGNYLDNSNKEEVSYGGSVTTKFTSVVEGTTATLTAEKSVGDYTGYDSNRSTTFVVNVSKEPTKLTAKNGNSEITLKKVATQEEFDEAKGNVYFYNEAPNLNKYTKTEENFDVEITTNPKLYVKFAETNVNANEQKLVIEGFENKAEFSKNEINENLAAPVLTNDEEALTPTSATLKWEAVEGAETYEIMADGIINSVGNNTTFLDRNLAYHSQHTYKVRARNAAGYSAWSNELNVETLEDPWRNVPEQTVNWEYGDAWGALKNANDKNFNSMFHSTNSAIGKDLIIDLQSAYHLDKFEYYPRGAGQSGDGAVGIGSNGTVSQMDVSVSMDGKHWTKVHDGASDTWTYEKGASIIDSGKTVDLSGNAARYVKLNVVKSNGGFFATNGIYVHKKDGSTGFAVGSNTNKSTVTEGDYTNLSQYYGVSKYFQSTTFAAQIKAHYADLNNNDIYDAYDYAYTLFQLDGGTQKTGDVAGNMLFIPSADTVKAGETFTVDIYGDAMKNVNGFGALISYDPNLISDAKVTQTPFVSSMINLSRNTPFDDGTGAMLNIAVMNRGDKALVNGNGTIATVTMTAKEDLNLKTKAVDSILQIDNAFLMGPNYSTVNARINETPDVPQVPDVKETKLSEDDVTMTMTNDILTEDDGKNIEKLIQQNSYSGLFSEATNDFEFIWNIKGQEDKFNQPYVTLPLTLHAALKEEQTLSTITLFNRADLGQGAVSKVKYVITYADDTKEEKIIEELTQEYAYSPLKPTTKIKNVDVTVSAADDADAEKMKYLTLSELRFIHSDKVAITDVKLSDSNVKELYEREISPVRATIITSPDDDANKFYKVESSDPTVANIILTGEGNNISYLVHALKEGTTTITVSSISDPEKKASYELKVKAGVSTTDLMDALAKANTYGPAIYTEESYQNLKIAVTEATDLLNSGTYTKDQVDKAATAIMTAINALEMKPLNNEQLINTDANKDAVSVVEVSSEITADDGEDGAVINVLDYNSNSYWHTNYLNADDLKMPHNIVFDLGKNYDLNNVTFLPRQGQNTNGDILKAEIQVSDDGKTFTSVGVFEFANDGKYLTSKDWQRAAFESTSARYVNFIVLNAGGASVNTYASMAEIRFYGEEKQEIIETDKKALETAINEAAKLVDSNYTEDSWATFQKALDEAKKVYGSETADQTAIDTAVKALTEAQDKLVERKPVVDKAALNIQIAAAELLKETDYTAKTWADFAKALKEAKDVVANENATVEEVNVASKNLTKAINALEKLNDKPDVNPSNNKESLNKMINSAETFLKVNYTEESWTAFANALQTAKDVYANAGATEEEIKNAEKALGEAMGKLVPVSSNNDDNNADKDNSDKDNSNKDADKDTNKDSAKEESNNGTETGDTTNTGLLAGTMLLGGAAAVALVLKKRKEEAEAE